MHYKSVLQYSLLLYVLFVTACSAPEKPVTKEEAKEVAIILTESIAQRKAGRLNELIDLDALEERIRKQTQGNLNESMLKGAMKSMLSGEFGHQVVSGLGKKGTYELVKQYEKNNHQHLVFRLYNETLAYHDFELIKKKDKVKIADIFIYITGENLSSSLAQSLQSMSDMPAGAINIGKKDLEKIQLIKSCVNRQDFERADELYKSLPALIRHQKLYKIFYIEIAGGLGTDEYLATLNKFKQEYPDAPNMYLLMIDAYFLKKDYAGALQCVNSLDSLINKDPFLDYYRALIYGQSEDKTNHLICLEKLQKNLPKFGAGTLELIYTYVEDKQWDKAVPLAQLYNKSKRADTEAIETLYLLHPDFKKKMEAATVTNQ